MRGGLLFEEVDDVLLHVEGLDALRVALDHVTLPVDQELEKLPREEGRGKAIGSVDEGNKDACGVMEFTFHPISSVTTSWLLLRNCQTGWAPGPLTSTLLNMGKVTPYFLFTKAFIVPSSSGSCLPNWLLREGWWWKTKVSVALSIFRSLARSVYRLVGLGEPGGAFDDAHQGNPNTTKPSSLCFS